MKEETPRLKDSLKHFRKLLFLIKPYWFKLIKGMSLGIILGVIGMAIPYFTKLLIDKVYPASDLNLMYVIVIGILAFSITSSVIGLIQGYFNMVVNTKLSNATNLMFFNHIQYLKIRFFDEHQVGEIMSRFRDVGTALNTVNNVFQTIFVNGIYLFIVPPFLLILNWKLAVVSLITIPLTVITISITGKFMRKYWKKTSEAYADISAFQVEMFTNIRVLKALALEKYVYKKTDEKITSAINMQLKAAGMGQMLGLINGILQAGNTALFTYLGWIYIISKEMTLGDYIAFTSYIGYLYNPIRQFVGLISDFQQSSVSFTRMYEYLEAEPEQTPVYFSDENLKEVKPVKGDIELKNVSFSYNGTKEILKNINLHISPGTINAVIGQSGSGKSTLLRLLIRLEETENGNILIDHKEIKNYELDELRRNITVIWQEFSIFKGTIWENLTLGSERVNQQEVDEIIKLCRMDEFIKNLPQGYETNIGEFGTTISGGQRQRLSIARALIRNTPVLIFDEATSNIDITTETEILNDIFKKYRNKTIIIVTHRVASISKADKIFMLSDGELIAQGSHLELLNCCTKYRDLLDNHQSIKHNELVVN